MKKVLAIITAMAIAATFAVTAGAIEYSESNKDIDIIQGEFAGYRFYGPDAPIGDIDTSQIASVKFYIKCPDLEDIEQAMVKLAYNSGTTSWVEEDHDLNDGLIVELDVEGVVAGDYFDAALGTWDEEVWGTFSVEVLDAAGDVLGVGVYGSNAGEDEEEEEEENEEEEEEVNNEEEGIENIENNEEEEQGNPAATGSSEVAVAIVMTAISAAAIVSMRKKSKAPPEED